MNKYDTCPEIQAVLNNHKLSANNMLSGAQSQLLFDTFSGKLSSLFEISESVDGDVLNLNIPNIKKVITKWKSEMDDCYQTFLLNIQSKEEKTAEDQFKGMAMKILVDETKAIYDGLNKELDEVELDFKNAVRLYRSPIRAALTDLSMLYNAENNGKGDFSGFENVSVYVHGIEDTGEGFKNSAISAAQGGDVLIYIMPNGERTYYTIREFKGERIIGEFESIEELEKDELYKGKKGRLHIIYTTENKNEHRQETSDDLAHKLNEMGLMNDNIKIDMFAQSYGGRRSLQFAIDYPDNVRSITTIGTPYDTNILAKSANRAPLIADGILRRETKDNSDYLDFNTENQKNTKGVKYSNAYTDMSSESLSEDIKKIKTANPEVYDKLQKMEITAMAGYKIVQPSLFPPGVKVGEKLSDDVVSVKSQNAEILGEFIDKRPQIPVRGIIGHLNEIENPRFVSVIKGVNKKQMDRSIK